MYTRYKILTLLLLGSLSLQAQTEEELQQLEALPVEETSEDLSIEDDRFIYEFEDLRDQRMDINKATETDLAKIPFLSPVQISDILLYRQKYGDFVSKYELQVIPSLDSTTVQYLVYIFNFDKNKETFTESRGRFFTYWYGTSPTQDGFNRGKYLGARFKNTNRIRYTNDKYAMGLCTESDQGERFLFGENQFGSDHLVGFFQKKFKKGIITDLIIGNYSVQLGQGLTMWQRFALNNANGSAFIKRSSTTFSPFVSVREYNYMRGLAISLQKGKTKLDLWASHRPLDGTLQEDTSDQSIFINNFAITGLHRTQTEYDKRMQITEINTGFQLTNNIHKNLSLGLYGHYSKYSDPIVPYDNYYSRYRFTGDQNSFLGMSYSYRNAFWNVFGEFAVQNFENWVTNLGMIYSVSRKLDFAVYGMFQSPEFQSLYGNSYLMRNNVPNDQLYFGIDFYPKYKSKVSFFTNHVKYKQFRYLLPAYTEEWQNGITYTRKFSKQEELYMRYTSRLYPRYDNSDIIKAIDYKNQHQFKVRYRKKFAKKLTWTQALYYSYLKNETVEQQNFGFAITQEFSWDLSFNTRLKLRFAYFENDDFLNRIYTFEPNIPYQYSLRFFNGRGYQFIINLKQKVTKNSTLYARFFTETQPGRESLGSSYEETLGPTERNFSVMYQFNF